MGTRWLALSALVVLVAGCDKSGSTPASGAGSGGSASTTSASSGGSKLTAQQISNAHMEIFGPKRMNDPFEAKLKDLKAKLGEPMKTEGTELVWWGPGEAVSTGKYCQELRVDPSKKGAMLKQTDKSKCGL